MNQQQSIEERIRAEAGDASTKWVRERKIHTSASQIMAYESGYKNSLKTRIPIEAENERLRGLIKAAHYAGWYNGMVNAYKHEFSWDEFAKKNNLEALSSADKNKDQ